MKEGKISRVICEIQSFVLVRGPRVIPLYEILFDIPFHFPSSIFITIAKTSTQMIVLKYII